MDAPPGDWLFQTKLKVEANSGDAVFLPTRDVLADGYDETTTSAGGSTCSTATGSSSPIGRTCSVTWDEGFDATATRCGAPRRSRPPGCRRPTSRRRSPAHAGDGRHLDARPRRARAPSGVDAAFAPAGRRLRDVARRTGRSWPPSSRRTCRRSPTRRSPRPRLVAARLRGRPRAPRDRRAGAAGVPVHEPRHARPAHPHARSPRSAPPTPTLTIDDAARRGRGDGRQGRLVAPVPARVHPAAAAGAHRPDRRATAAATPPTSSCCSSRPVAARPRPTSASRRSPSPSAASRATSTADDGALDGGDGVAVLMRYTLRLLTSQQFQRAAALVCAAELIRQEDPTTWGERAVPHRAVGRLRVSPKRYTEAEAQVAGRPVRRQARALRPHRAAAQALPLVRHQDRPEARRRRRRRPPSGSTSTAATARATARSRATATPTGRCRSLTVDDEIYRQPADVPARHRRQVRPAGARGRGGEPVRLRRRVVPAPRLPPPRRPRRACTGQSHNAEDRGRQRPTRRCTVADGRPAAAAGPDHPGRAAPHHRRARHRRRGLRERRRRAVARTHATAQPVRPLVVASTATVRNAENQVRALYGRGVEVFPPQVLDVRDTFFSQEIDGHRRRPGPQVPRRLRPRHPAHARRDPDRPRSCCSPGRSCSTSTATRPTRT